MPLRKPDAAMLEASERRLGKLQGSLRRVPP